MTHYAIANTTSGQSLGIYAADTPLAAYRYLLADAGGDTILHGREAIDYAEREGLTLHKHADPTEDARDGLTIDEAEGVAAIDPALVWIDRGGHIPRDLVITEVATPDA